MKVLFVASGNKNDKSGIVVRNQADSLLGEGLILDLYLIRGKGLTGYLRNVYPLYKKIKNENVDIIHSHYALSAMATTMAMFFISDKPHVVSLMGSDTRASGINRILIKFFCKFFWTAMIVKSKSMLSDAGIKNALIIPNGVDINKIKKIEIESYIFQGPSLNNANKKTILFAADPARISKNFLLAKSAVVKTNCNLKVAYNKPHEEIIKEIIKSDLLILTSNWEGSPNIVKEAMACNCPVVATDVGDVRWLFGDEPGHFIASFDPEDVADKIKQALEFSEKHGRTNGRQRIIELGLDAETVAKRIVWIYEEVLQKQ